MQPIGIIHSPFTEKSQIPSQSTKAPDVKAYIELFSKFQKGSLGLKAGQKILIIFGFHQNKRADLQTIPKHGNKLKGIFATRSPHRPNFLGVSVVKLDRIESNKLHFSGCDMMEGSPVWDIKPYIK
jgi:tRNA-Thr(GGU) m(6)t(6)A37 methyltransferase TsaA